MQFLFIFLLCCTPVRANYPEDVYFFELGPAVWDYYVSPEGGKMSIYRALDIVGEDFFLNLNVFVRNQGSEYRYSLVFSLDEKGNAALIRFSDGRGAASFAPPPAVFPAAEFAEKPFRLLLAKGIALEKAEIPEDDFRNSKADVSYRLWLGDVPVELLLRYRGGIVQVSCGGRVFSKTTQRIFNAAK